MCGEVRECVFEEGAVPSQRSGDLGNRQCALPRERERERERERSKD